MASNGSLKIILSVAAAFFVLYLLQNGFGRRKSSSMGYHENMENEEDMKEGYAGYQDINPSSYDVPPNDNLAYRNNMPGTCGCQGPCDCRLKIPSQVTCPPGPSPDSPTCPTEVVDQCSSAGTYPTAQASPQASCFPKSQLSPEELLPSEECNVWSKSNPHGSGTLADRNFLQAGWATGVSTVGSTLRNANRQLRSEPPNPQVKVSPWLSSTIGPDLGRKPLEVGGCA